MNKSAKQLSFIQRKLHLDPTLLTGLLVLALIGLATLYSAGNQSIGLVKSQIIHLTIACGGMLVIAQISPSTLKRWAPAMYLFALAMLAAVLVLGVVGKGAQRWLDLGFMRFQPSELMKVALPLMVSWYLSDRVLPPRIKYVAATAAIILIPTLMIAKQPDLGTSLLVASSGFFAIFLAGMSGRLLLALTGLVGAFVPVLWFFLMRPYQKQRVLTFLDPERDPLGTGYHIIQSKIAIGSGGIFGKGWLNGTQSRLDFLPERSTDFIFSVFSEEFGLIGAVILLCVYLLVIARGLYIAAEASSTFGRLLAGSISLTFFVHVFVNIGMVSGLLPVVGMPLPLISKGGTSLLTLMIGFGLLQSVHTHRKLMS